MDPDQDTRPDSLGLRFEIRIPAQRLDDLAARRATCVMLLPFGAEAR